MRSDKLRHRITIQQAIETQGPTGEMSVVWSDFADVAASVEPLRGREFWAAKEMQAQVTTRIRIRYLEGVTPKMQVLFSKSSGIKSYLIDSVINEEERDKYMQLMCQEIVST